MNFAEHEFIREVEKNLNGLSPALESMWDHGRLVERDSTIKEYIKNEIDHSVEAFARAGGSRYSGTHLRLLVDAVIQSHDLRKHFAEKTANLLLRCPNWGWCKRASLALFELYQHLGSGRAGQQGGGEVIRQISSSGIIKEALKDRLHKLGVPQQETELEALQLTMNIFSIGMGTGNKSVFNVISKPSVITVMETRGFGPFKKMVPVQKAITHQTKVGKPIDQIIREHGL